MPDVLANAIVSELIDTLIEYPDNPREGDVGAICEAVETNGYLVPVVAQVSSRRVIDGNHRLKAAKALGMTEVPVVWVDVDDETALRHLLAANRTNDLAGYNDPKLAEILTDLMQSTERQLAGTAFDGAFLDSLIAGLTAAATLDPMAEWEGLGEYEQNDLRSRYRVTVHFATDDDAEAFFRFIDRPRKTFMWWPAHDGHVGSTRTSEYSGDVIE